MIMFHTDENECKNIFSEIFRQLEDKELEEVSSFSLIYELEKKQELYQEYLDKDKSYKSGIKVSHSTNPEYFIKDKMENFDRREKILICFNNG